MVIGRWMRSDAREWSKRIVNRPQRAGCVVMMSHPVFPDALRSKKPPVTRRPTMEALEPRLLLSAAFPSANEQYMVELVNYARANPVAVATQFGIDLNEGLPAGTISPDPKQPLAINPDLVDGARGHSQWMLDNDLFQHNGPGTTNPGTRMSNAGYSFVAPYSWAENIAWQGNTATQPDQTKTTTQMNQALFVDAGIDDRGHRTNMLDPNSKEIGVGIVNGLFTQDGTTYKSVMATEDFASTAGNSFLTGVAYNDADKNNFYTPGEGLGDVTVTAQRITDGASFTTTTWASGGYSLQLAPGTYNVTASGGGLSGTVGYSQVAIANLNIDRDFTNATPQVDFVRPTAALSAGNIVYGGPQDDTFSVTYRDNVGINPASIGNGNIVVSGPGGYSADATLLGIDSSQGPTALRAVYRILAPNNSWSWGDDGTYTVSLNSEQVADMAGNAALGATLGSFTVNIAPPAQAGGGASLPLLTEQTMVSGADAGSAPYVQGFNPDGSLRFKMLAFDAGYTGGVRVATADVSGDGVADLIVAPGAGVGPNVRVFDGITGRQLSGPLGSFYAYDPGFMGGVYVAGGDVSGDGRADIITGTSNGPPNVKIFSGADGSVLGSFFAFNPGFLGGVRVAGADINGDGRADIIAGAGPGAGPNVKVFDGRTFNTISSFFAYAPAYSGGVYVAGGDVNGDGRADIITGAGTVSHVRAFSGVDNSILASFIAYPGFDGGVRVGAAYVSGGGAMDILTATAAGAAPHVKAFSVWQGLTTVESFFAGAPDGDPYGLYIA